MKVKLNPDNEVVLEIRKAIENSGGYCPCSLIRTKNFICPCYKFRYEQECECGLYMKTEDNE
jgi:ferredoxin-thioredoxin reductase catalytic subunit